MSWCM